MVHLVVQILESGLYFNAFLFKKNQSLHTLLGQLNKKELKRQGFFRVTFIYVLSCLQSTWKAHNSHFQVVTL